MSRIQSQLLPPQQLAPPVTAEAVLKELKERRRVRRILRDLAAGKWREMLLAYSQHRFPVLKNNAGRLSSLLVKVNLVGAAMQMHANVLTGNPPMVTAPEGFDAQQEAINDIKARCLTDTLMLQAAELVNIEGEAAVRAGIEKGRVVLAIEDNDVCFPTGRLGPDQQPSGWERRWVIEIPDPADQRNKINVLRVESHWRPDGVDAAAVAQRAYRIETSEPLTCVMADGVKPFPMERIPGLGPDDAADVVLPGGSGGGTDIVQLVIGRRPVGGSSSAAPRARLNENDLDLIDAFTASVTRLMRSLELHAEPRMRVPERLVDKATGRVNADAKAFVDENKEAEYLTLDAKFSEMLEVGDKLTDQLLALMHMAPPLLGMNLKGGATPDTFGKLELNSQGTLTSAATAARYMTPPLERAWTVACLMASSLPGGGFDVAPVSVRLSPGLYQTFAAKVEEQSAALAAGVTSRRRAVAAIHGEENADAVMAEIEGDQAMAADLAAKSLMSDLGSGQSGGAGGETGKQNGNDAAKVAA